MAIAINGSGTLTGISVGGLPDGIVDTDMLAAAAVTSAKRGATGILGYAKQTTGSSTDCSAFSSFTTIGSFALSYTPVSSSSKLFFITQLNMTVRGVNASYYGAAEIRILNGLGGSSENVYLLRPPGSGTATAHTWPVTICHEFDPVNTNARDFEIQIHNAEAISGGADNGSIFINQYSGLSWMSVLEVKV